jgi:hypothetical protein
MPKYLSVIDKPTFKNIKEVYSSPSISSGFLTLNLNDGNVFLVNLNANILTITISNPPNSAFVGNFVLVFTADGTARGVAWPNSIKWGEVGAPTLTSTNGKKDIFNFITYDGGTNWYGSVAGQNI